MKIYTKQGDRGQTGLLGGARVPKNHLRIHAYGSLDELNSVLGMLLALNPGFKELKAPISRIQSELFQLGTELATPLGKSPGIRLIGEGEIRQLENEIDQMESDLPTLKTFILPGGSTQSAGLQIARTVCRRAEREIISLHQEEEVRAEVLQYINRMSDYFFVFARWANHLNHVADLPWISPQ